MIKKIANFIVRSTTETKYKPWVNKLILTILLLIPFIILGFFILTSRGKHVSTIRSFDNQSVASIADDLQDRLDHLSDTGIVFSERLQFRQMVANKKWNEVFTYAPNSIFDTSLGAYIYGMSMQDSSGKVVASTVPGVSSRTDFSFAEWFARKDFSPVSYVSNLYQGVQSNPFNLVSVSFPVLDTNFKSTNGVLTLMYKDTYFQDWIDGLTLNSNKTLYVIDQKGQIVASTNPRTDNRIVTISDSPVVQKLLSGSSGEEMVQDPLGDGTKDIIYAPVKNYNWGVLLEKPSTKLISSYEFDLATLRLIFVIIYVYILVLVIRKIILQNRS